MKKQSMEQERAAKREEKRDSGCKSRIFGRGVVALVALVMALMLAGCGAKKVDMQAFFNVEFFGLDSRGKAHITVDYDSLGQVGKPGDIRHAITCELDRDSELSNGDTVNVLVTTDAAKCKAMGIEVKKTKIPVKVTGLTEIELIDAFAGVEVTFSGTDPDRVDATFSKDESCQMYTYYPSDWYHFSNGDVFTLTIDEEEAEAIAYETGKFPVQFSKDYPISGMPTRIDDMSQVWAYLEAPPKKWVKVLEDEIAPCSEPEVDFKTELVGYGKSNSDCYVFVRAYIDDGKGGRDYYCRDYTAFYIREYYGSASSATCFMYHIDYVAVEEDGAFSFSYYEENSAHSPDDLFTWYGITDYVSLVEDAA